MRRNYEKRKKIPKTANCTHLAEGSDQLLVHGLVAVLGEDAQQGLPLVQGLGGLPQSAGKTVSDQSLKCSTLAKSTPDKWILIENHSRTCLSTSWIASLMPMGPVASTGAALGTSPSTSDMLGSSIVPNTANIQSQISSKLRHPHICIRIKLTWFPMVETVLNLSNQQWLEF